jgi:hypothetical protein
MHPGTFEQVSFSSDYAPDLQAALNKVQDL